MKKIFYLLVIFMLFNNTCLTAEEAINITTYYPAPYGDYENIRANSTENYNVISNPSPINADPSGLSFEEDFRFVNVNRGLRVFGACVGGYVGTSGPDANTIDLNTLNYIELNPVNADIFFKQSGQIRSVDNSHSILFNTTDNQLELKEFGDIVFSPGAVDGVSTAKMVLNSEGYLGIGTRRPKHVLDLGRSLGKKLAVYQKANGSDFYGFGISSGTLEFHAASLAEEGPAMVIKSNNRIGIGITDPKYSVEVQGTFAVRNRENAHATWDNMQFFSTGTYAMIDANHNESGLFLDSDANIVMRAGRRWSNGFFHVIGDKNGTATYPESNVAVIENKNSGSNTDVLFLKMNRLNPGTACNFITFRDSGSDTLGSIQGNGSGGVQYGGSGEDYAEYLERLDLNENLDGGDIVGVYGDKITKETVNANQIMVISSNPVVVGNMPQESERDLYRPVVFIGQTDVNVRGDVQLGDFIIPLGDSDGIGIAVAPDEITPAQYNQIAGVAWEASLDNNVKQINIAVGVHYRNDLLTRFAKAIEDLQEEIRELKERS